MANNELETLVDKIEAKTEKIKASLEHSTDMLELTNLKACYSNLIGIDFGRINREYWADDPRATDEVGRAGANKVMVRKTDSGLPGGMLTGPSSMGTGVLGLNPISVGYITISKDGNMAYGVWDQFSPHSMEVTPYPGDERKLTQYWFLCRYNSSYLKQEGKWKCLTQQVIIYFRTPYDQGWLRQPDCKDNPTRGIPTVLALNSVYHPDGFFIPEPPPPEPEE